MHVLYYAEQKKSSLFAKKIKPKLLGFISFIIQ